MTQHPSSLEKPLFGQNPESVTNKLAGANNRNPPATFREVIDADFELFARITEAQCLYESLELVGGDDCPPWVPLLRMHVTAIAGAADALAGLLRGYGGNNPHGDSGASDADGFPPRGAACPDLVPDCAP